MKSYVVVSKAPKMDYTRDYVALPKEYGTPGWFARPDIAAIRKTVRDNKTKLGFCLAQCRVCGNGLSQYH